MMDASLPGPVHRFAHEAMGTFYEALIAGCDQEYSRQASQAVFHDVDRLELLFSRFNPSSEISQINHLRPGEVLKIGWETYECLEAAEQVRTGTGGAFDVNFRAARRFETQELCGPPESSPISRPAFDIFPIPDGFAIRVNQLMFEDHGKGVDVDLGGIGKGFALDRAAAILADWSIEHFLIHAGTSTALAAGSAPAAAPGESGWPVGVGGAWTVPGVGNRILLRNQALSGSGTEVKGQHIRDPKAGDPATAHLAAWVSHPRAAVADALSTAFMVMSTPDVERYCEDHPDVWALVIGQDGQGRLFNTHLLTA
jgi:thiamine biosynthesis lipoprotein